MTKISGEFHFHPKTPQQTQGRLCLIRFMDSKGLPRLKLPAKQFAVRLWYPWQCPRCPGPHPSTLPRLPKWSAQCIDSFMGIHMDSHRRKMQHKGYSSFPSNVTKMHKEEDSWLPCSLSLELLPLHDRFPQRPTTLAVVLDCHRHPQRLPGLPLQYPFLANSCHQQTPQKKVSRSILRNASTPPYFRKRWPHMDRCHSIWICQWMFFKVTLHGFRCHISKARMTRTLGGSEMPSTP